MDFLSGLASNILANIIFWLGLGFVVWITVQVSQIKFRKFFGLNDKRQYRVYLSNLWTPREGRTEGYTISEHEFRASESIATLFGSAPFRLPELVRGLVDSFWLGNQIIIKTTASPIDSDKVSFTDNMIIVGGVGRNTVRKHYINTAASHLLFSGEKELLEGKELTRPYHIIITKGNRINQTITGDYHFAIVEKFHDKEHKIVVFMCLGFRGDISWGAVQYLVYNWQKLHKKYQDKEFAMCLGFPKTNEYMTTYEEPIILASFPD